jgi:hypothetical protein
MNEHFGDRPQYPPWPGKYIPSHQSQQRDAMKPSTAADCLAHIRGQITPTQYDEALARIEQLVAAQRAIAAQEMYEAHFAAFPPVPPGKDNGQ